MLNEFEERQERAYLDQSLQGSVGTLYNTKDQKIKASEPSCSTRSITQELSTKDLTKRVDLKDRTMDRKYIRNHEHCLKDKGVCILYNIKDLKIKA